VELVAFTARQQSAAAVVRAWATASETANAGFGVEVSADGRRWTHLGFVAGKGSRTSAVYYRLAQTD
jgi:hypothetical protein